MKYWQRFMAVAVGGFIGGIMRELISFLLNQPHLPLGTLVINLTGTFLSVLVTTIAARYGHVPQILLDFVSVGILGAYTTYATLITELSTEFTFWTGLGYGLISIIGSVAMVYLARYLGKEVAR
ncbi:CrcB protein [Weissella uvarum]|uniref:FluC/FEX family fluoride channel n=1 Tax=Weissella uvarum TaxID=1479233 RepID=UPI00195F5649|nr:CrcB family protein [Weissella uvarum]MBM7617818.1 CrcB protein [Weissella uvarum]MCM0595803.1 CrcB family protein [Weissella uvarum]